MHKQTLTKLLVYLVWAVVGLGLITVSWERFAGQLRDGPRRPDNSAKAEIMEWLRKNTGGCGDSNPCGCHGCAFVSSAEIV